MFLYLFLGLNIIDVAYVNLNKLTLVDVSLIQCSVLHENMMLNENILIAQLTTKVTG